MSKVRIGFVGCGFMGQAAHLRNYVNIPDCEVVALAEPREELAKLVAERYGIKKVYKDHIELMDNCQVDGIVCSQPFRNTKNIVPDILKRGIPVFTEKPISLSVETGEMLANLAKENDAIYMVGYHKRSDPAMEYAKELVEKWKASGEFGKMKYVRITMPPGDWIAGVDSPFSTDEPSPQSELEPDVDYFDANGAYEYLMFVNFYIHQVNAMRYFFGEPYKVTFADRSGVLLAAESESGVCGVIEMDIYQNTLEWQEKIFIGFEKGYINIELPPPLISQQAGKVTVMEDNGKGTPVTYSPSFPALSAMRNQAANFIAAIKKEKPVPCDAAEAVEDLIVAKDYITLMKKY